MYHNVVDSSAAQQENSRSHQDVLTAFHRWFYENRVNTWRDTRWLGVPVLKDPFDMWTYQEVIVETRPDVLIETGTFKGGSASYYASIFDLIGRGRVCTIDVQKDPEAPRHPRITYLEGSSTSDSIIQHVKTAIHPGERVMVVLDSDHTKQHVLNELRIYSKLVTPGCYLVVEDTNVNGHPVAPDFGPGPWEAVDEFLRDHPAYKIDKYRERLGMTFCPNGWLKRIA